VVDDRDGIGVVVKVIPVVTLTVVAVVTVIWEKDSSLKRVKIELFKIAFGYISRM
jgi:hypothetical protein